MAVWIAVARLRRLRPARETHRSGADARSIWSNLIGPAEAVPCYKAFWPLRLHRLKLSANCKTFSRGCTGRAWFGLRFDEVHGGGVHAVAQAGWLGAVIEDVAEMRLAASAPDFGAFDAERGIALFDQVFF